MSSAPPTPESLRPTRADSKNPAATCKGITGNGRNCRRALALGGNGVRRQSNIDGPEFYCHQHKDQAQLGPRRREDAIREKSSIETLVQRLGISEKTVKTVGSGRKDGRTQEADFAAAGNGKWEEEQLPKRRKPKKQHPSFWSSLLCCTAGDEEEDYVEIIRHRKRMDAAATKKSTTSRPTPDRNPSSNTATNNLLALLPPHLSPETTSSLLSELVKPISPADEEGYIYIYWLTKSSANEETARNLLAPPEKQGSRRISELLPADEGTKPGTIMLKIGRASNVTRRMREWERQCGFKLNLVRWYPYVGHEEERASEVHKVPCVKRVERLIHLELAGQQVRRQCGACGKEHREWFEVGASREGVRDVDAVVRRWVKWAEERV